MKKNNLSNKGLILEYIANNTDVTKQHIQHDLKLSLPTINTYIKELLDEKVIEVSGKEVNTGGRSSVQYSIHRGHFYSIGIDITQNHVNIVLLDLSGSIVGMSRSRLNYEKNTKYYKNINDLIGALISRKKIDKKKILGVGVGIPGLVDNNNTQVVYGEILKNTGLTIHDFATSIPYPIKLFNDANAAGYAEIRTHKHDHSTFYLMLSNNVGGAILINDQIYSGNTLKSGEVGHLTLVPDGKLCYCGQKGCVDCYCAANVLAKETSGNLKQFFEELEQGKHQEIWDQYCTYLARCINNLRMLFDSTIIIGGYVGSYIDSYIPMIKDRCHQLNSFRDKGDYVMACFYKTEAIAAGSALPFIDDYLSNF